MFTTSPLAVPPNILMDDSAKKILTLMFRPGETICVSPNQYGYHSIPLENVIAGPVVLVPTPDSVAKRKLTFEDAIERVRPSAITLCALNPIKGYRSDANCTHFRNFLVEMDYGPILEQLAYVNKIGMPFSAAIFSGNKSIHFLISLDRDLPSEKVYRLFSQWLLGVVTLADQNTQNPSRSIRVPGAFREPGKQQLLMEYRGVIKVEELVAWLSRHPGAKPQEKQQRSVSDKPDIEGVKPWVARRLLDGIVPPNRNKQWFTVAVEFALSGFSEDDTIDTLRPYFEPDRDFKEKEWEAAIQSAFKWTYERKRNV